jgi:glutamate/tyrosine decarboxylase-like PLP-dependent enzyme
MANLSALAAARQDRLTRESSGSPSSRSAERLRIYFSQETHHSIAKGVRLLGIAPECLREVRACPDGKMDLDDLVGKIRADRRDGHVPFAVVASAGTVMTGAIDPLNDVANVADEHDLWMHVDACYGGFAAMAPSLKPLLRGIERADTVALDPHKWLYLPVDCGCVLYRDPEAARRSFAHEAAYTRVIGEKADEAFVYWDYGPELSRRFRALKVWMVLKGVGLRALGHAIAENVECARYFENLVRESDDFEMLAPVALSIFCFRWLPVPLRKPGRDENAVDQLNEALLVALQHDGSSYLSNAIVNGRFALRGCVMNYRTTKRDMETLLDDLRRVANGMNGMTKSE